jgi:hypothetical protein
MARPDPELLPMHRPRCPRCKMRMITRDVAAGPEGFERRTVECSHCGFSEIKVIACDPIKSDAVGWIIGDMGSSVTHEGHEGRPKPGE